MLLKSEFQTVSLDNQALVSISNGINDAVILLPNQQ